MKKDLILKALDQIETDSRELTEWLDLFSAYKYDGYRGYQVGGRFRASLVAWLNQFTDIEERRVALEVIRKQLIFISAAELNTLIRSIHQRFVLERINHKAAKLQNGSKFDYWRLPNYAEYVISERRKFFFCGLSDGARLDNFRRENHGLISNEQCALTHEIGRERWKKFHRKLKDKEGADAKFETIFLIDDFTGSGYTMLHWDDDSNEFDGKLHTFLKNIDNRKDIFDSIFDKDFKVVVLHYIGTEKAQAHLLEQLKRAKFESSIKEYYERVDFEFCLILKQEFCLDEENHSEFHTLAQNYYDPGIETEHTVKGGGVLKGFGSCQLPLVLEHNCPNNSFAILWAESGPGNFANHQMMPLFRRRSRH